jgi:hypothetical protein
MKIAILIGASAALLSSTAFAADLEKPLPEQTSGPALTGYFAVQGGGQTVASSYSNGDNYSSRGANVSGAARAALAIDPNFSVQGDLWDRYFYEQRNNPAQTSWQDNYPGVAAHLSWHPNGDADLVGVFGSLGQTEYTPLNNNTDSSSTTDWATEGVEGVLNMDNWRLYGQAGVVEQLSGPTSSGNDRNAYAVAEATYFITPNLAASGWVGANGYSSNSGTGTGARIGTRLEWQPEGSPVSFFAAYQVRGAWDNYTAFARAGQTGTETEQTAMVGLRIPFGTSTVQALEQTTGLVEMNPNYGEFPQ